MTPATHFLSPPDLPEMKGQALCALCADRGTACCATDPAQGHLSFPLSLPEWRRLALWRAASENPPAAAPPGQAPPAGGDDCCQVWPNTPDFIASMDALFPDEMQRVARLFPPNGEHFSLRLRRDGSCVFLGEAGCRVPRQTRPWYCRLFPVWFTADEPGLFAAKGCLIAERARSRAHGIRLLDVPLDDLREIFSRLREDWGMSRE